VVVVDWVAVLSDAHEVSMTPTSVEKSEIAIVNFFIVTFDVVSLSPVVGAIIILVIMLIVMTPVPIVLAAFSAHVLAVNPMVTKARHMARDPDHFIVAVPIARAMVIKRPVANLD
jgi:hypothetical protein